MNKIALREQIMKIRTIFGLTVPRIEHKILSLSSISLVLVNIKLKSDLFLLTIHVYMCQEQPQLFSEYSELNCLNAEGYCIYKGNS